MSNDAPRVMVVDDDEDIRETVGMVLAASGYTAVPAVDGADALDLLGDEGTRPSLILLDLRMPRLSGEQVMQQLRATPALAGIPVVLMSGDGGAPETARALGAASCLAKPIELDDLERVVKTYAGAAHA